MSTQETKPEVKKSHHKAPQAKAPEIDYEKLSGMVADKLGASIIMSRGKELDNRSVEIEPIADIKLQGNVINTSTQLETTGGPLNSDYLAELAFMEEEVDVIVAESTNDNDENPVAVGCNGQFVYLLRGNPTRVKRKFVNSLIVKTGRVTTPEIQVPGVGGGTERSFAIRQNSAHKYPFSVVGDSQKGMEWLTRRLREAV